MAKFCPHCGKPLYEGAGFCGGCGARVQGPAEPQPVPRSQPQPQHQSQPQPQYRPAQPQAQGYAAPARRSCPRCGNPMDPDAVFCDLCGFNSANPAAAPAAPVAAAPRKKHTALIVVLALLLLSGVGAGIYFGLIRKPEGEGTPPTTAAQSRPGKSGSASSTEADRPTEPTEPSQLQPGFSSATLLDVIGSWSGSFSFTAIQGMENVPGAPENVEQMVAMLMATPEAMELELKDDRSWRFEIQGMMPLEFSSGDMTVKEPRNEQEATQQLFRGPEGSGHVSFGPITLQEADEAGLFDMQADLLQDSEGPCLSGVFIMDMTMQGAHVRVEGSFQLRKAPAEP